MTAPQRTSLDFIRFLTDLLERRGFIVQQDYIAGDRRIDFVLSPSVPDAHVIVVEVKLNTPQTAMRVAHTISQVRLNARAFSHAHPEVDVSSAIAVPGVFTGSYLQEFDQDDVMVWDGRALLEWAREADLLSEAVRMLSIRPGESLEEIRRRLNRESQNLPSLEDIPAGRIGWSQYQKSCKSILEHLFVPPLERAYYENETESGANRRDIIMANYATEGFWSFLRTHYSADYIVVDAKNLTGRVSKSNVLQMANYLSIGGTGLFGLLITRNGLDRSAKVIQREQWLLHRKMILALTHDDINQMLDAHFLSGDADVVIRQRIEDFRLSI